jgi:heat shock protein HslJ
VVAFGRDFISRTPIESTVNRLSGVPHLPDVDAVVVNRDGGSALFRALASLERQKGVTLSVVARVVRSFLEGGKLLVSVVRAGEKDAMCCPGELADLGWTLAGGKLSPVATAGVAGRLSLDTLAGTEWVLRAWDLEEPAPAEPEVTLAYKDGRLAGTSGCNRYTAAAKAGESLGDLAIGPAAGTRMACPEPQSAVETRFLKQLGGAKKFGFLLGRLALSYEKDGGAFGTMVFEGRTPAATANP